MKALSIMGCAAVLALTGCTDRTEKKPEPVVTAAAGDAPVRLDQALPAALAGLPWEVAGRCAVDIVNTALSTEVATIRRAEGFSIYGWALDDRTGVVPPVAVLQLTGATSSYYAPLARRADRDDLAQVLGNAEYRKAGFGAVVDIATLPAGRYDIVILQKGDKTSVACATKRSVVLVE